MIKIIKEQKIIEKKNKELKFKEEKQKIKKELIKKLKTGEKTNNEVVDKIIIKKEFKYLEELTDEEINESKDNYIVIDPGKRTILQMMQQKNNKTNILTYTSKQRTFDIKTNKFKKKLKNYKIKNKMIELETELSKTCCRTVDVKEFKNYIKKRNEIYDKMELLYEKSKYNK